MRSVVARLWTVTAAAGILVVAGAAPSAAVTGWTGPIQVRTGHPVTEVRAGVSSTGKVMIVGLDEAGVFAIPDAANPSDLARLAPRSRVLDDPLDASVIAGVFDRGGHTYAAWARGCAGSDCSQAGIWFATDASGGANHGFASPVRLVAGKVRQPAIQLLSGHLHLAYVDAQDRLHYRTNASGPWTDVTITGQGAFDPVLVLDDAGKPQIGVVLATPTRWGMHWAEFIGTAARPTFRLHKVPDTGDLDFHPLLGIGVGGRPWMGWTASNCSGVDPCPKPAARLVQWTGSTWSKPQTVARAEGLGLRFTPGKSARVFTDRATLVSQEASGWTRVTLYTPVANGGTLTAGALALTTAGKAVVVFSDTIRTSTGKKVDKLYLMRQR